MEIKVAVLETELKGLREQQKAHATETQKALQSLSADIRDLMQVMNRGRGAFAFGLFLASAIGAGAMKVLTAMLGKIQ